MTSPKAVQNGRKVAYNFRPLALQAGAPSIFHQSHTLSDAAKPQVFRQPLAASFILPFCWGRGALRVIYLSVFLFIRIRMYIHMSSRTKNIDVY